jgi:hypothetical protein
MCWTGAPAKCRVVVAAAESPRDGAEGQNRTADTAVFSRVLYRLSYLGTSPS